MTPEDLHDWAANFSAYHARVAKLIGPHLKGDDRAWLDQATAAL